MAEALQRITGHTMAKIQEDFQRDFYLSSSEAAEYGIIDEVLLPRGKNRQGLYKERGVRCFRRQRQQQQQRCSKTFLIRRRVVSGLLAYMP